MKWLFSLAFVAAASLATGAVADRALVSKEGVVYAETATDSGSRLFNAAETITLTDTCAAEIAGRGQGWWHWTATGTRVTVGAYSVSFADVPLIPMVRCAG